MWIVLDPRKAHRFTTQGINLYAKNPMAFVAPDLDPEIMDCIYKAISDGIIFEINDPKSIPIAGVGTMKIEDDVATETGHFITKTDEDGHKFTVLSFTKDDNKDLTTQSTPKPKGIVLTDIEEY